MSRLHLSAKLLPLFVVALALALLAIACAPQAASVPTTTASASLWAAKPDATGHYYAGNPDAKLVVEEWGDLQ